MRSLHAGDVVISGLNAYRLYDAALSSLLPSVNAHRS